MIPIHKVCSKDELRPALHYFQVKHGYVYATDANILLKLSVEEVFGSIHLEPIIGAQEELYFHAKEWATGKFHTCKMIYRDGLTFKSDKDTSIVAITADEMMEVGRYPDIDAVIPDANKPLSPVTRMGVDFLLLHELCSAFGKVDPRVFVQYYYGEDKCILVKHPVREGFGLLMPTCIDNYPLHPLQIDQ